MRETLSESQIIEYEQKADEMIKLIAWISIASLIILIIGEVGFSDSRTLSKWYVIAHINCITAGRRKNDVAARSDPSGL